MHIQIEAATRANGQPDVSRPSMQLPGASHAAVSVDSAAARAGMEPALNAAQFDASRSRLDINIARAGKRRIDVPAARVAVKRGRYILGADAAASGLDMSAAAEIAQPDVTGPGLCLHFAANALDANVSGTTMRLHDGIRR